MHNAAMENAVDRSLLPSLRSLRMAAALTGAAGVAAGAFGAHALRSTLDAAHLATWQTAVQYLFWHVLAALIALHWPVRDSGRSARGAALCFLVGVLCFSGSLFALALSAPRWLGALTPVGGLVLIGGWGLLARTAWRP